MRWMHAWLPLIGWVLAVVVGMVPTAVAAEDVDRGEDANSSVFQTTVATDEEPLQEEKLAAAAVGTTTRNASNSKSRIISLAESIEITRKSLKDPRVEEVRRKYWKDTFEDIRKLASGTITTGTNTTGMKMNFGTTWNFTTSATNSNNARFLSQWKLLSNSTTTDAMMTLSPSLADTAESTTTSTSDDNKSQILSSRKQRPSLMRKRTPRFDGFPTWDRMLQDWNDEIQDYLDQIQQENDAMKTYSIGNYGRPTTTNKTTTTNNNEVARVLRGVPTHTDFTAASSSNNKIPILQPVVSASTTAASSTIPVTAELPIPAPAKPGQDVLPHTDIADKSKKILVVTTASLPWKTGTAVNPLLRAAYLTEGRADAGGSVTLLLPWLERQEDQLRVYGTSNTFATEQDQEEYIRTWLRDSASLPEASRNLNIQWYTAWQNKVENSIYSMGDITAVSPNDIDICILEEPEHLNWYRAPGESWTKKYRHVVGILHTNYFSYALDQPAALIRAPAMRLLCSWMCRAHCHRVIKLSGTLDKVAPEKELVENVHGVRHTFLDVGEQVKSLLLRQSAEKGVFAADAEPKVYFIGKMLWSKGLGSLMELLKYAEESANLAVAVDMYGGGPDMETAATKAEKLNLEMPFHGPLDHAELAFSHKIFVNPSTSEVLCTTSAEALAMGKFVIIPSHPSNDFFAQFPNCLTYASKEEFVGNLYYAMTHEPFPLTDEYAFALSWEAATQRLEAAGCIPREEAEQLEKALSSEDAGIEIALPSIIDDKVNRNGLSTVLRYSRGRYRMFRTRLSQEIRETKVLPQSVKDRLVNELDKRLDLDIDKFLESPKLRLKLSPAELDKSLLEFYDSVSESPGGDILRVIGGGGSIGLQNFYMRRRAERERWHKLRDGGALEIFPTFADEESTDEMPANPSQLVRRSLRRNVPSFGLNSIRIQQEKKPSQNGRRHKNTPKMCYGTHSSTSTKNIHTWNGFRSSHTLNPARTSCSKFSILI